MHVSIITIIVVIDHVLSNIFVVSCFVIYFLRANWCAAVLIIGVKNDYTDKNALML